MKIEIGEYVRTKKGNIGKVLDISTCTGQKRKKYLIKWNIVKAYYITGTTIVKHSPDIIDLIETGDYVNGYKVRGKTNEKVVVDYYCYSQELCDGYWVSMKEKDIYSIVTKEQFSNMEYRV